MPHQPKRIQPSASFQDAFLPLGHGEIRRATGFTATYLRSLFRELEQCGAAYPFPPSVLLILSSGEKRHYRMNPARLAKLRQDLDLEYYKRVAEESHPHTVIELNWSIWSSSTPLDWLDDNDLPW